MSEVKFKINARPSNGSNFADRFRGDFSGTATIKTVERVKTGKYKNAVVVHLSAPELKGQEIHDWYQPKATASDSYNETAINRLANLCRSAGIETPENGETVSRTQMENLAKKAEGKKVVCRQFTQAGFTQPNVAYFYDLEDGETSGDDEDEIPFD